jgi:histidine triad (HIT) family protein
MLKPFAIHLYSQLSRFFYSMNPSCTFCKIAAGEAKATIVYQDEQVTAFRDIHPVAPTHVLIVPNRHIESLNHASAEDESTLGHLFVVARKIAAMDGIAEGGYRIIVNTNANGGQTIFHLHLHLIGGQRMRYPMG